MARRICRTLVSRQLRFRLVHRPPGLPVRRPRVLLVQPPRARPRPSPQLRVLPVRKPPSSRSWQLLALPPWPLRARPCGRLHAPPSPPPRVARVRQPRPLSPPAFPHLRQNVFAPRRRLFPVRRLLAWRGCRLLSLREPPAPRRHALLARLRLRGPWPLAWPF